MCLYARVLASRVLEASAKVNDPKGEQHAKVRDGAKRVLRAPGKWVQTLRDNQALTRVLDTLGLRL
jgi:hypothetical protein